MATEALTKLPTTSRLGIALESVTKADHKAIASAWLNAFSSAAASNNVSAVLNLITPDGWWRDLLSLTWDFRTFHNHNEIKSFLSERLSWAKLSNFRLTLSAIDNPYPDLAWLRGHFEFDTHVGSGSGVFRLVPTKSSTSANTLEWRAFSVFTSLESLRGFPEALGPLRNFEPSHGKWIDQRAREAAYTDHDPEVVVIGGGQSGLEIAARLKLLGVETLICEKQPRIGDQWRKRYAALCLHDVVWYDHMPYLPFPDMWPVYTPAQKLADWLEHYAKSMELNIWNSTTVTSVRRVGSKWEVTVDKGDTNRVLTVDHVVFAIGVGGGTPNMPKYPGMDKFKGQILHSTQHGKALDHAGKKVVVVGACTSAHDISMDYAENGVDVTIYQRNPTYIMTNKEGMPRIMSVYWEGGPPTEIADNIDQSLPVWFKKQFSRRITKDIADADRELLDGLERVGFQLTQGDEDSGLMLMVLTRLGGYYLDVGASQAIVDGKIKLKSGSQISHFTERAMVFEDGSQLECDVAIFATGYGDPREPMRKLLGPQLGPKIPQIWGLDDSGEVQNCWKELAVGEPNLWLIMGNFAMCRFYSKRLALQIKAKQEGLFDGRCYSSDSAA